MSRSSDIEKITNLTSTKVFYCNVVHFKVSTLVLAYLIQSFIDSLKDSFCERDYVGNPQDYEK